MAKVSFSNINFQKTLSKKINARFLVDFQSDKKSSLTNKFSEDIQRVSKSLVEKRADEINTLAKLKYKQALDEIGVILSTGISTATGNPVPAGKKWSAFSPTYFKRKLRETPSTAFFFWRGKGDLSLSYNRFKAGHKGGVTRSKPGVTILPSGKKFRNKVLRFRLDFSYPVPRRGGIFFEQIFLNSFFSGIPKDVAGLNTGDSDLNKIGFLEGAGSSTRHRPFISELMALRGRQFNAELQKLLLKT